MTDWQLDNINVDTLHRDDGNEYVVEINGEKHILSEREADTLKGELSISGVKNPNKGRYNKSQRHG